MSGRMAPDRTRGERVADERRALGDAPGPSSAMSQVSMIVAQRSAGDAERVGHAATRREPGVAQQRDDVVVARHVPVAEVGLVDRVVVAQAVEEREGIVAGLVGEEVVGHR